MEGCGEGLRLGDNINMASASCTPSRTLSYVDFMKCSRDARFERVPKEIGSKKLVCGEWVVVIPGDEDAVQESPNG